MKNVYLTKIFAHPPIFRTTPEYYPPWDLICLSSVLKDTGYEVALYHEDPSTLLSSLRNIEKNATVIIDVPFDDRIAPSIDFTRKLHAYRPDTTKIWIGQFPSFFPEQCIRENFIQFVVSGNHHGAVPAILENRYRDAAGIFYKNELGTYSGSGIACSPYDRMVEPDLNALDFHKYIYTGRDGARYLQYEIVCVPNSFTSAAGQC